MLFRTALSCENSDGAGVYGFTALLHAWPSFA